MRRLKISRKQWEGIGKKAGWMKPLHRENADEDYWSESVKLDRIGDSLILREGDTAILTCKVEPLFQLLERVMGLLRDEQIQKKHEEECENGQWGASNQP